MVANESLSHLPDLPACQVILKCRALLGVSPVLAHILGLLAGIAAVSKTLALGPALLASASLYLLDLPKPLSR